MKIHYPSLGPLETRFFAWAQLKKSPSVRTGDLQNEIGLSPRQETNLLYNLSRSGFVLKLWRGFYLIPERIPAGSWSPSPYLILASYMNELGAKYQISGPAIFNYYGYSNQVSSEFVVYNNRRSKRVHILQYRFNFVKVRESRLGETRELHTRGENFAAKVHISTAEQTLLDAVYDYKKYRSLPEAYQWISDALKKKKINSKKLVSLTSRHGNTITKRRIGYLLQKLGIPKAIYRQLSNATPKTKFLVPMDPRNFNGPINSDWRVIENAKISAR